MLAALQDATLLTSRPLFCKVKTAILDHELPLPWNGGNMASLEQSHVLEQSQVFDVVLHSSRIGWRISLRSASDGLVCQVTSSLTRPGRWTAEQFGQPEWAMYSVCPTPTSSLACAGVMEATCKR